ncbi:MAG: glycosyltransferase family 4 protein [Dinghuibacter sp.]|nr:glycosyltransferase family 4 protein [Dinghuibacter sp.]
MRIAVNTRFLLPGYLEGYGHFIREVFSRLVQQHPQHEFIFLFDRPYEQPYVFGSNVQPVVIGPPARHPVLWKWWYDYRVPPILKKLRADVLVSPDGFCSLRTRVPQVTVIHDLAFLHRPKDITRSHLLFYKTYTPKFIKKSSRVITVSETSAQDILQHYPAAANKITVAPNAAREIFQPLTWEQKEAVKAQYTGGKEYFLYTGSIHPRKNLVGLLKAFSVFKKWQQSDMKLLLCGRMAWKNGEFLESLNTYKYRKDVQLTGYLPETELAQLVAAAYAMVYPSFFEGFGMPLVEAMQAGTPVVASDIAALRETGGDAVLLANPNDFNDLAAQMMHVYKDESLRARLIEKGKIQAARFNWQQTAETVWACIQKAAEK